jgi:alkanesulfonate monooxygenase SsuD/methylene tetrahydromethanopterin reductase-like flavin-dependent oxidoreductase (luciferase family)
VFVADDRKEALKFCEAGFRVYGARRAGLRRMPPGASVEEAINALDIHTGTPEEVIASLQADTALARATDWSVQVHSIDPPHPYIMRSIELMAQVVAPALGWQPAATVQ